MSSVNNFGRGITMKWWGGSIIAFLNVIIVIFLIVVLIILFRLRHEIAVYGGIQGESDNMWMFVFAFLLLGIPTFIGGICLLVFALRRWREKSSLLKKAQLSNALIPFLGLVISVFGSGNSIMLVTFSICLMALLVALAIITTYLTFRARSEMLKAAAVKP